MLPVIPMAVRVAPGMGCGVRFMRRMAETTASICSGVAWVFMTTSMARSPDGAEHRRALSVRIAGARRGGKSARRNEGEAGAPSSRDQPIEVVPSASRKRNGCGPASPREYCDCTDCLYHNQTAPAAQRVDDLRAGGAPNNLGR